ncbi:unnamed protein product, partial [Polarella glacialis]
ALHAELHERIQREETDRVVSMLQDADAGSSSQRDLIKRVRNMVSAGTTPETAQQEIVEELVAQSQDEVRRRVIEAFGSMRLEAEGDLYSRQLSVAHELEALEAKVIALRGGTLCEEAKAQGFDFGLAEQVRQSLKAAPTQAVATGLVNGTIMQGSSSSAPSLHGLLGGASGLLRAADGEPEPSPVSARASSPRSRAALSPQASQASLTCGQGVGNGEEGYFNSVSGQPPRSISKGSLSARGSGVLEDPLEASLRSTSLVVVPGPRGGATRELLGPGVGLAGQEIREEDLAATEQDQGLGHEDAQGRSLRTQSEMTQVDGRWRKQSELTLDGFPLEEEAAAPRETQRGPPPPVLNSPSGSSATIAGAAGDAVPLEEVLRSSPASPSELSSGAKSRVATFAFVAAQAGAAAARARAVVGMQTSSPSAAPSGQQVQGPPLLVKTPAAGLVPPVQISGGGPTDGRVPQMMFSQLPQQQQPQQQQQQQQLPQMAVQQSPRQVQQPYAMPRVMTPRRTMGSPPAAPPQMQVLQPPSAQVQQRAPSAQGLQPSHMAPQVSPRFGGAVPMQVPMHGQVMTPRGVPYPQQMSASAPYAQQSSAPVAFHPTAATLGARAL